MLAYKQPLDIIDQHVTAHRAFLEEGYQKNYFITSGPQNPRTGGVIISQLQNREQLETLIKDDPFHIHNLADYEIIEFVPLKYHVNFAAFIGTPESNL